MVNAPGRFDDEKGSLRPPGTVLDPSDETNPCLICQATGRIVLYPFEARDVVQCVECQFTYAHPMPEPGFFDDTYAGEYWTEYNVAVGEPDIHERIDEFLEISAERVERLQRFKSSGSLLDVGCSMGFLVKAGADAGFTARGIDLSEETLSEGRSRFGVDIQASQIADLPNDELYDAITCYNTIEHIVEVQDFVDEMAARLAPDGVLALGTHDVDSAAHRKEKRMWKHIMPTEHVFYFRAQDLAEIGKRARLELFYVEKPIPGFQIPDNLIVAYFHSLGERD